MGGFADFQVKRAAIFLMAILKEKEPFQYGVEIYNGSEEWSNTLCTDLEVQEGAGEHLVDVALYELEEMNLIFRIELNSFLADGEQDFTVSLTDQGRASLDKVESLSFWGAE